MGARKGDRRMTRQVNERASKRVPVEASGEICRKEDKQALALCRVVNISSVGLQVESPGPLPQNEPMVVRFLLNTKPMEIPWDVVWTQEDGDARRYGIRLTQVDALTKDRIRRFVNEWVKLQAKERPSS